MLAHRLEALVVASCQTNSEFLRKTQLEETPLILLDRSFKDLESHFVGSDDYSAGKLAAEHLLSIGCRRIAHIRGPENSVGKRRLKGFADTLRKHGVEIAADHILQVARGDVDGRSSGADALRRMQQLRRLPDGVFCYNDVIAVGVINEALRQGIDVPKELAVIGCGNLHYDDEIRVPLSSIDQRSDEIGSRTARLILDILGDETSGTCREIVLQPRLVARASTAQKLAQRASNARG